MSGLPSWLIPSGVCTFSGNEQQLKAAIGSVEGKLRENGQFTCLLGLPVFLYVIQRGDCVEQFQGKFGK